MNWPSCDPPGIKDFWKGVSKVYLHSLGGCAGAEFVGDFAGVTAPAPPAQRMLWLTAASTPGEWCREAMRGGPVPAGESFCHRESRRIQVLSFLADLWIFDSTMAPVNPISISLLNLDWGQQNSVQSHSPVPGFHPSSHSSYEYLPCFFSQRLETVCLHCKINPAVGLC